MAKKKRTARVTPVQTGATVQQGDASTGASVQPAPPISSVQTSPSTPVAPMGRKRGWVLPLIIAGAISLVVGVGAMVLLQPRAVSEADLKPPTSIGNVVGCRGTPRFVRTQGFGTSAALDTSESASNLVGAVLIEPGAGGAAPRTWQHPSWDDAGYLGPILRDWDGNLLVVPVPRISNWENPLNRQNRIYRIDSTSAEMKLLMELPVEASPTLSNPYGTLGLALDCETKSVYVSGISGSTRERELGRVYRLDLSGAQPVVTSILDGIDAFGMVVFNGSKTKRLYLASARSGEVRSVALDARGDFIGQPRSEFSVSGLHGDGDDRIRRMDVAANNAELQLRGIEFGYNLVPAREKTETRYTFRYERTEDKFVFVDAASEAKGVR